MSRHSKPQRAVMLLVRRDEEGRTFVHDANGNAREIWAQEDYARVIQEVLDDETLPQVEGVPTHEAQIEQLVVAQAEKLVRPALRPFVGPMVGKIKSTLQKLSKREPAPPRKRSKQAPGPTVRRRRSPVV